MSLRVWLPTSTGEEFERELRRRLAPDVRLTFGAEPPPERDHEVLVSGRPTDDQLASSARLRSVIVPWAGIPPATRERLRPHGGRLTLHNLHHNAAATAEMAVALLLAAAKSVVPRDRDLRRGDWGRRLDHESAALLHGHRALVLGFGSIGRRVARTLHAMGMEVHATRRRAGRVERIDSVEVHPAAALDDLLPGAHALVACLPDTPETAGILCARRLGLLPPGATLVNVGRGTAIEEDALFAALTEGHLGAAGLDVWWRYPGDAEPRSSCLPSRRPFGALDNVVLSPHRAGHAAESEPRRAAALAELLAAASRGEDMPNRVDLDAGY